MRNALCLIAVLCALTVLPLPGYPADKASAAAAPCHSTASNACYQTFTPEGARGASRGALHHYASLPTHEADTAEPTRALVAMHGFPRDANKTFNAALLAAQKADAIADTLVLAPVSQVPDSQDKSCRTPGVPTARRDDLVWTCSAWAGGGVATNDPGITSFAALDALLKHLKARWPSLAYAAYDRAMLSKNPQRTVTIVPGCAHDVACVFPNEAAR